MERVHWHPTDNPHLDRVKPLTATCCLHLDHLSLTFCILLLETLSVLGESRCLRVRLAFSISQREITQDHILQSDATPKLPLSLVIVQVLSLRCSALPPYFPQLPQKAWQDFPQLHCLDLSYFSALPSNVLHVVAYGFFVPSSIT